MDVKITACHQCDNHIQKPEAYFALYQSHCPLLGKNPIDITRRWKACPVWARDSQDHFLSINRNNIHVNYQHMFTLHLIVAYTQQRPK